MRQIVAIALGIAFACTPIRPRPSPTAPSNVCPDHPCSAYSTYSTGSPMCTRGVCLDPPTAAAVHLVLVVASPVNARTLPGQTFAVPFAGVDLSKAPADGTPARLPLPPVALTSGSYRVQASTTLPPPQGLGWNLGNLDTTEETSLPVHVTYRALWPPVPPAAGGAADAGPPSRTDAVAAGLPLYPIQVESVPTPIYRVLGPAQGPAMAFRAALEPGFYEQTIAPDAPFDQAYPPDVSVVNMASNDSENNVTVIPDKTIETTKEGSALLPSFDISRIDGSLDGWTAYLRDATTRRPISPIRPLSGMTTTNVLLPTSHRPVADALDNAELVVAPPDGQALPIFVEAPRGKQFSAQWTYPPLPAPTMVHGRINWSDFQPGTADVVFEATGIYAALPPANPGDAGLMDAGGDDGSSEAGDAGPNYTLQPGNFEFTARATAEPDPSVPGASTYEIGPLPRGNYRVIVRPRDGPPTASQPTSHEVSIFEGIDVGSAGEAHPAALLVDVTRRIVGTAVVADGRALSGAVIEALPVHCSKPSGLVLTTTDAPSCMPRYQSTITADDGLFSLSLDPGDYLIRAEPADGTRLPWVSQAIHVPGSSSVTLTIPAPTYRGFELEDSEGHPITDAIVRMFTTVNGPAVEVGRAVTNASGRFDMYLDPRIQ